MRASEFVVENASVGATASGSIATVPAGLGPVQSRSGSMFTGKYTNDPFPNTPDWIKKAKKKRK